MLRLETVFQYCHGLLGRFSTHMKYSFPHATCYCSPQNSLLQYSLKNFMLRHSRDSKKNQVTYFKIKSTSTHIHDINRMSKS